MEQHPSRKNLTGSVQSSKNLSSKVEKDQVRNCLCVKEDSALASGGLAEWIVR
jgi:hypothetical protein